MAESWRSSYRSWYAPRYMRLDRGRLDFFGPTPFRARVVDAGGKLAFRRGFAEKHLLSAPAPHSSVVHRKYRFSPRPPHQPPHPELSSEECHKSNVGLQAAPQLTLWTALRALRYTLWDGDQGHL